MLRCTTPREPLSAEFAPGRSAVGIAPVLCKERIIAGVPLIETEEIAAVTRCLESGWLGPGPETEQFESEFAAYKRAPHALAVNSGTSAIQLALAALGIQEGDEVIAPVMTFSPSLHTILHRGARLVLADVRRDTFNIDPNDIERKITPRTKAILVVHMCGRMCEMDEVMALAARHHLRVIEDCAHAIESGYRGQTSGLIGDIGCFSFYATKNLTTGDGGMVITRSPRLFRRMRLIARQGVTSSAWNRFLSGKNAYKVAALGYRCGMNDLSAALGRVQLKKLEQRWLERQRIWQTYQRNLEDMPVELPPQAEPSTRHAFHLFTALLSDKAVDRAKVMQAMRDAGIITGIHYVPAHEQPFFRRTFKLKRADFPNATYVGERTLTLPLAPQLTKNDIDRVCTSFRGAVDETLPRREM